MIVTVLSIHFLDTAHDSSSQLNDSSNDVTSTEVQDEFQPTILSVPPRPIIIKNVNHFGSSNISMSNAQTNIEKPIGNGYVNNDASISTGSTALVTQEVPRFLFNTGSAPSDFVGPPMPMISSNTIDTSTEHIYENVPTLMQTMLNQHVTHNQSPSINNNQQKHPSNGYLYYSNNTTCESGLLTGHSDGSSYSLSEQASSISSPMNDMLSNDRSLSIDTQPIQKPQIVSSGRHRSQPVYFANHLTNPMFNVDKQLLINTIANQFGVELHSPQLQNLILNQHLFVARKRTFANMVWQLSPDDETALCSSPLSSLLSTNTIDVDVERSTARSILKAHKNSCSPSKRHGISWDSTLET
jgi:hypothetical protein